MLSKEDLWEALKEYPEAKRKLIEKGREVLRKDNLLDEELAKEQDGDECTLENKIETVETLMTRATVGVARLMGDFSSLQAKLKKRVATIEAQLDRAQNIDAPKEALTTCLCGNSL